MNIRRVRVLVLTLAVSLGLSGAATADEDVVSGVIDEIKKNCSAEWPSDYRMQKYCRKKQHAALMKLTGYAEKWPKGSEEMAIIGRCMVDWPGKAGGTDFRMAAYCTDKQIEAYNELK